MQINTLDYRPTQILPKTATTGGEVFCKTYSPSLFLKPHVVSYWHIASYTNLLATHHHRILPDGCIDIVLNFSNMKEEQALVVAGPTARSIMVPLFRKVNYLGICFRPGSFHALFGVPASELTDSMVPLSDLGSLIPPGYVERLQSLENVADRVEYIDAMLCSRLTQTHHIKDGPTEALRVIYETRGCVQISDLAKQSHTSPRNFSRQFIRRIGLAPKVFCRIIRFQNLLRDLKNHPIQNRLSLALDAGYYDQAHWNHEFRAFTGQSPTELLFP